MDLGKGRNMSFSVYYEDSVKNMEMVDMACGKSGLGPRPSGRFKAS